MFLHERWLGDILESLCKLTLVWQITDNLFIYIIAQLVGTEIDIACIGKRTMFLFVTRK